MKKRTECEWFVEPLDDQTNQIIFRHLAETGAGGDDDMFIHLPDSKGTFHNVLKVPDHRFIAQLQRSRENLDLHFLIFTREGGGKLKLWPFTATKRLSPKAREIIAKARRADAKA